MSTIIHKPQQSTYNERLLDNIDALKTSKEKIIKIKDELTFLERQLFDKKLKQKLHTYYAELFNRYECLHNELNNEYITLQFLTDMNHNYLFRICYVITDTIEAETKNKVVIEKSKMIVPNIDDNKRITSIKTSYINSVSCMSSKKETIMYINDEALQGFRKVAVINDESFYTQTKEVDTYTVETLVNYLGKEIYSLTEYEFFNVINDRLIVPKNLNQVI